jgi:beta-phosphoglucomutase-like phosphatase (HAD superfamily)
MSAEQRECAVLREVLGARTPSRAATSAADMDRGKPAPDPVQVAPQKARIAPEQACSQATLL